MGNRNPTFVHYISYIHVHSVQYIHTHLPLSPEGVRHEMSYVYHILVFDPDRSFVFGHHDGGRFLAGVYGGVPGLGILT